MGTYMLRVTAKQVTCADGRRANVVAFAYKPSYSHGGDALNRKWHFSSGALSSDQMAARGGISERVVYGDQVYTNTDMMGTFTDDMLGGKFFPSIKMGVRS